MNIGLGFGLFTLILLLDVSSGGLLKSTSIENELTSNTKMEMPDEQESDSGDYEVSSLLQVLNGLARTEDPSEATDVQTSNEYVQPDLSDDSEQDGIRICNILPVVMVVVVEKEKPWRGPWDKPSGGRWDMSWARPWEKPWESSWEMPWGGSREMPWRTPLAMPWGGSREMPWRAPLAMPWGGSREMPWRTPLAMPWDILRDRSWDGRRLAK